MQATGSEQVWVTDITYLPTQGKFVYLSLITDAYSRKIVDWHVHARLQTEVPPTHRRIFDSRSMI